MLSRSLCLMRPHTMPRSQLPVLSGALNVEEAADYLRVSRATIWRLLSTKELRRVRIGGRTVIRRVDLDSFLEQAAETR
jgi:excisionase family DNA binding protein